jgi:hypothetical protein
VSSSAPRHMVCQGQADRESPQNVCGVSHDEHVMERRFDRVPLRFQFNLSERVPESPFELRQSKMTRRDLAKTSVRLAVRVGVDRTSHDVASWHVGDCKVSQFANRRSVLALTCGPGCLDEMSKQRR